MYSNSKRLCSDLQKISLPTSLDVATNTKYDVHLLFSLVSMIFSVSHYKKVRIAVALEAGTAATTDLAEISVSFQSTNNQFGFSVLSSPI